MITTVSDGIFIPLLMTLLVFIKTHYAEFNRDTHQIAQVELVFKNELSFHWHLLLLGILPASTETAP